MTEVVGQGHDSPVDDRVVEVVDGGTTWRIHRGFVSSRWTCIWGRGCLGILDEPAPERQEGCCSLGAELLDDDEARLISALAALVPHRRLTVRARSTGSRRCAGSFR